VTLCEARCLRRGQVLAGPAAGGQAAGAKGALAHTLVPPPYAAPMPHPPPAHTLTPASDMALEGKARPAPAHGAVVVALRAG